MKRYEEFDIAKATCIIFIVAFWHVLDYLNIRPDGIANDLAFQIVTSCLALFVFLSGLFLGKHAINDFNDIKIFYRKRFFRIYPLFFISSLSMLCIGKMDLNTFFKSIIGISPYFPPQPLTLWFISMLLGFYCITPIINYQKNNLRKVIISIGFFLFIMLFNRYTNKIDQKVISYAPFYFIGLIVKIKDFELIYKKKFIFFWILCIGIIVFFRFKNFGFFSMIANIDFIYNFFGSILILTIADWLKYIQKLKNILLKISYGSMALYLFHRQIYFLFILFIPKDFTYQIIYFALIVIPITIILTYYIQTKYDLLNKIITRNNVQ